MALQLTPEEFGKIKDIFKTIDLNYDEKLSKEELTEYYGLEKLDKVDFVLKLMDLDGNGTIEFHEFLEMVAFIDFKKGITSEKILRFFRALDADGNGTLSVAELRSFYTAMQHCAVFNSKTPSNDEIENIISSLDVNGAGKIDCEEFIKGYFHLL